MFTSVLIRQLVKTIGSMLIKDLMNEGRIKLSIYEKVIFYVNNFLNHIYKLQEILIINWIIT